MNKTQEALKMVNNILEDEMWFPNKYPDQAIPVCFIEAIKACKEALAELQEHDNEVIEKCAKVVESMIEYESVIDAIRALKGKQNE